MTKLSESFFVKYAGICGSDINKARGSLFRKADILNLGHEIVCSSDSEDLYVVNPFNCDSYCDKCIEKSYLHCSKVVRIGANTNNGGYSGKIITTHDCLFKIPNSISHPEIGVLCDGVAVVFHGLHMVNLRGSSKIAIIGAGTIGVLTAIIIGELFPAISIDLFYRSESKREFIYKQFGKKFNNINIAEASSISNMYDIVFEAVGGEQTDTITKAINIVKNNGSIIVFGAFHENCIILRDLRKLFYKQISLLGINSYCKKCRDFEKAVAWTFNHESILFPLLTNRYIIDVNSIDSNNIFKSVIDNKLFKGYFDYE